VPRAVSFIARFSADCPFLDLVTSDVNYVRKEKYLKVIVRREILIIT
jgi:hypothetical protein